MTDAVADAEDTVAIVGVACRMPGGADDLAGLWDILEQGRDVVTTVPPDRFDTGRFVDARGPRPGRSLTAAGGFLDDVSQFDAEFFGISPREASRIDPQQRLLLELAVEALDDAGQDGTALAGSDTAVFIGISGHDYADLQAADTDSVNAWTMAGGTAANAANRISYTLDWHGESTAVDTACSSSLTALHLACGHLRAGRSRAALAGGVSILLNPAPFVGFSAAAMLSPTGRCRSFAADADGYVRSEGGGAVLLKRLADALADGDRVHGLILATGANSDGRTAGLSVPNSAAQEALLRETYARAGVPPDDLVYFEAHGTGTPSGDPIECAAIGHALGRHRTAGPLPIGSVKSNLGHQECASGMAGLLKALLVLRHRRIPRTLHAEPLNPHIPFDAWGLAPVLGDLPVPAAAARPVVGVNSFGFGGANAHAVLAAPPPPRPRPAPAPRPVPLTVSGRTPRAAAAMAGRMADRLAAAGNAEFRDAAWTATRRRAHHEHRAVVLADGPAEAAHALRALAAGDRAPGAATATAVARGRTAFVFSGNGSQWAGMGAGLLAREETFAAAVADVDKALARHLGWSVAAALASGVHADPGLADAAVAQPLLFAVQAGLVSLLRAHGITPSAVLGHSVGEIAAAWAAGALDLPAAALVVAARSRTQAATAGAGRMAAVGLPEAAARKELAAFGGRVELAGVNSPRDVTLAGPAADLAELGRQLSGRDVFFRMLDLDYAYHSRSMDPIEEPLRAALARLRPARPALPFASGVTGALLDGTDLDGDYWWRNVREPVLFAEAAEALLAEGCDVLVEIGPHPVLTPYLRRVTNLRAEPAAIVPTCRREDDGPDRMHRAVARILASGAAADWSAVFPEPGRVVDLPAYSWQRERHWNGAPGWWSRSGEGEAGGGPHPLLGARLPAGDAVWSGPVEPARVPWLADHRVDGLVVMPGVAYLEMAFAAAGQLAPGPVEVQHLAISRAIVLPWDDEAAGGPRVQVSAGPDGQALRIATREGADADWREHARCRARRLLRAVPPPLDVDAVLARLRPWPGAAEAYEQAARRGLGLGPAFRVVTGLWARDGEALAAFAGEVDTDGYRAHPALLDGVMQAGACLAAELTGQDALFLPAAVESARSWDDVPAAGWLHARCREVTGTEVGWDFTVTDRTGRIVMELTGCRLRLFARGDSAAQRLTTVLRAAPRAADGAPCALPAPGALLAASAARRAALTAAHRAQRPERARRAAREVQAQLAARALTELLPDADEVGLPALLAAGLLPKYAGLCRLLLGLATEHGLLAPPHGRGEQPPRRVAAPPEPGRAVRAVLSAALLDQPGSLALFCHCGEHLAEVLCGRADPVEVLFADADRHLVEQFYSDTPDCRFHNRTARELLRAAVEAWPADQPLRILEVGGGTGGMTAELLQVLPPERTTYVFTDVSPAFLPRARARFAAHDFIEYRTLDLAADPVAQGLPAGGFDLVVAANALHVTADLRDCLRNVARLLADGGQLLAFEFHDARLGAIAFGLLDGFWAFTDTELRTASPLLPAERWATLLAECGFTDVCRAGEPVADGAEPAMSVLLARRAGGPAAADCGPPAAGGAGLVVAAERPADAAARALAAELGAAAGAPVPVVDAGAAGGLPGEVLSGVRGAPHVVFLLADDPAAADPAGALDEAVRRTAFLAALAGHEAFVSAPGAALSLVTRPCGALPAPAGVSHVRDAAVWAAARTFGNERPGVAVRRISLDRGPDPAADARRLARELLAPDDGDEVVLTRRGRFTPRMLPLGAAADGGTGEDADATTDAGEGEGEVAERAPFRLQLREASLTPRLAWVPAPTAAPGPGELLIEVRAAGLNYRDALLATGLLPAGAEDGAAVAHRLGLECAGVVRATGAGVEEFAPGDRVFALAPGSLASHVVTDARSAGRLPDGMDFAAGATLPVVWFTLHHGLERLARPVPGETALVHGGAGGVGLAAVHLLRSLGVTVIATAGTPAKRSLLRLLGVEHVLDSRSLRFAEEVRERTGGRGVDIVLNSLAGEALTRGLELLCTGGRFVELGKRDIYADSPLPMRLLRDNISVFVVDASRLTAAAPELAAERFRAVAEGVAAGTYPPLPHRQWPAAGVGQALAALQHSRHLGKVVIDLTRPPRVERPAEPPALDPGGTYLVAGGLSGLGADTARRLAGRGAGHLALLSRRGADTPGAAELLAALHGLGARTSVHAADVTDEAVLRGIVARAAAQGRPVRGVVHATMHIDDAPLAELTAERIRAVLAPKFLGGALLDGLTAELPLDLFLAYSSFAAGVGNLGQAAYAAGNLYLEALVRRRRAAGSPGLAVALGTLGETGFAARDPLLTSRLERIGVHPMTPAEAHAASLAFEAAGVGVGTVGHFDWDRLREVMPGVNGPRFAAVLSEGGGRPRDGGPEELGRRLSGLSEEEATGVVADVLAEELARVLHTEPDRIDRARRLDRLGMDSLMAAELVVAARRRLGCDLPALEIMNASGLTDLARRTVPRVGRAARKEHTGVRA
ncbi:type I polyketide synthase [Streptomyces sp. MP131-18]|uniref:type I polyketide synthase n=1 Tax=Streptomyces sp. MP131-18 TaxID=1857892 RepID=UPI00097C50EC|nr:type I polyketide synthase [Streptomyces sp. MP131-18]